MSDAHPQGTPEDPQSFYDAVGGEPLFRQLVENFYDGVKDDALLHPMYPKDDLDGAKHRLATFLMQFWGGPKTYGEERGHPRLRIRHAPFAVSPAARDAWLHHMRAALNSIDIAPLHEEMLWDYLQRAAHSLVNTHDGGPAPAAGQPIPGRLS